MENKLLQSKNQFNTLNNINLNTELEDNVKNILEMKRKNYLNEICNVITKDENKELMNLSNGTLEKENLLTNKNFNKNTNTINNDSKGLSNISPVNVYYYPLNNYSEFQRGFILQKLLNKNVLDTPNLELETTLRKEYSS